MKAIVHKRKQSTRNFFFSFYHTRPYKVRIGETSPSRQTAENPNGFIIWKGKVLNVSPWLLTLIHSGEFKAHEKLAT